MCVGTFTLCFWWYLLLEIAILLYLFSLKRMAVAGCQSYDQTRGLEMFFV